MTLERSLVVVHVDVLLCYCGCAFVSSHAKQIEDRKRLSPVSGKRQGIIAVGAPVQRCTVTGRPECTSSIMEPGVANREAEGKGAIKRRSNRH